MKELILRYGYSDAGKCNCDGFPTDKFIKGDYQLRVRTSKSMFKIRHQGRSVTQWIPVSKLQEALNNIHNVAVQA